MLAITLLIGLKMAAISSSGRGIRSVLRCPLAMYIFPRVDSSTAYKCSLFLVSSYDRLSQQLYGLWRGSAVCWDCGFEPRQGHGRLSLHSGVFSGRRLWDRPITRPEESNRVCCILV